MVWPATDWYLPGGEGMVVNRAGTVYAVQDADDCCCETTIATTTTTEAPATTTYGPDCPERDWCADDCGDAGSRLYAIIGTPGDPTTCLGFSYTGPYVFNLQGIIDCYWLAPTPPPPIVSDVLLIRCLDGTFWPDNLARWVMHLTVSVFPQNRACRWSRLVTGPHDCPNGMYTWYAPPPPPLGGGCADCADYPNVVVYS